MTIPRRLIFLAALALALAIPAAAQASTPNGPEYRFETRSANGYRIVVTARASTLFLAVIHNERARHAGASTIYVARARTHDGRITSRIGSLGSVSMTFHPSSNEAVEQSNCNSSRARPRPGTFVGSLRFLGEDGYVKLRAHRLRGVERHRGADCSVSATFSQAKPKAKIVRLFAGFRSGLDATYLFAHTLPSGGTRYEAQVETGGRDYAMFRVAYAYAPASTFLTDDSLSFAEITPPYPFSGTGSVQRAADGAPLWSGSLAATFPGAENVPLTGPLFNVHLTRSW